jgi:hypothetical protein
MKPRRRAALIGANKRSTSGASFELVCDLLATCVLAAITFLLFPRTHFVTAFIGPGSAVMGVIGRFLPDSVIYSVSPEGGAPSFSLLLSSPRSCFGRVRSPVPICCGEGRIEHARPNHAMQSTAAAPTPRFIESTSIGAHARSRHSG